MKATVNEKSNLTVELKGEALAVNDVKSPATWEFLSNDRVVLTLPGDDGEPRTVEAELLHLDRLTKKATLHVNGQSYTVQLKNELDELLEKMGMGPGAGSVQSKIKAPMPGMVLDVFVEPGKTVAKDEPLLILEAMKMENVIKAPQDGTVKLVGVVKGKAIEKNALLVEFEVE